MAIKLTSGMKVRIRTDLLVGHRYGKKEGMTFNKDMAKYAGQLAEIDFAGYDICLLNIDNGIHIWHEAMLTLPDYTDDELFIMYINKQITHEEYEEYMKRGV
jgi:hypothetical protein